MLTEYYRNEIIKAWGDPKKVAKTAYMSFLPYEIAAYWPNDETIGDAEFDLALEDSGSPLNVYYPASERAIDMGIMAVELKDDQEAFLQKLDEKMKEVFKDAVFRDN